MCCLGYEIDYYTDAAKQLPKVGAEVGTPDGRGTVASLNMLKMQVLFPKGNFLINMKSLLQEPSLYTYCATALMLMN